MVGIQATVAGMQGAGVSTPIAAAVAAATMGLLGVVHMANVGILAIGLASMMFAAGILPAIRVGLMTTKDAGACPNEHDNIAPIVTAVPMAFASTYRLVRP